MMLLPVTLLLTKVYTPVLIISLLNRSTKTVFCHTHLLDILYKQNDH